jgi:hypothetical protein
MCNNPISNNQEFIASANAMNYAQQNWAEETNTASRWRAWTSTTAFDWRCLSTSQPPKRHDRPADRLGGGQDNPC